MFRKRVADLNFGKNGTHILIRFWVKLFADSEFLVHFDIGPQFRYLAHGDWDICYEILIPHMLKKICEKVPRTTYKCLCAN
jgi:hypothetical protein